MTHMIIGDRPFPHSKDSEAALLSCLLQSPVDCEYWLTSLDETDFYIPAHRRVFRAFQSLAKAQPDADIISLCTYLDERGMLEDAGGMQYLRELARMVPSHAMVDDYGDYVQKYGQARRMIAQCTEIAGKMFEATKEEIPEILEMAERNVLQTARTSGGASLRTMGEVLNDAYKLAQGYANRDLNCIGYPTPFQGLNDMVSGVKPGEVIVLGARPSQGKTAAAAVIAEHMAIKGFPCYYGSLEMKSELLALRLMSSRKAINPQNVLKGIIGPDTFVFEMGAAVQEMSPIPIFWDDVSRYWAHIRRRIREAVVKHGAKAALIDYLQLMKMEGKFHSRENEVATMSNEVKALALELQIPIIINAQLNRGAEDKQPRSSDLRESGAIEQDADQVWLLHRLKSPADEDTRRMIAEGHPIPYKLIVDKNRNGPTGLVDLEFFPNYTRFADPQRVSDSDIPVN